MKMTDVKVGMRLKSTRDNCIFSPITVTEITEKGFKYSIDKEIPFIAREGSYFCKDGHEHFGVDEVDYEPIINDHIMTDEILESIKGMITAHKIFNDTYISGAKPDSKRYTDAVSNLAIARARLQISVRGLIDCDPAELTHPDLMQDQIEDLYQRLNKEVSKENILNLTDLLLYHINIRG